MGFFYYVRRSVLFKIHAANIEASKFFVLFLSVIISQMQVVCICYCYNYFSESRVARNTILIQRDVLWTGKI